MSFGVGEALSLAHAVIKIYKKCKEDAAKLEDACGLVNRTSVYLKTIVKESLEDKAEKLQIEDSL